MEGRVCQSDHVALTCVRSAGLIPTSIVEAALYQHLELLPGEAFGYPCAAAGVVISRGSPTVPPELGGSRWGQCWWHSSGALAAPSVPKLPLPLPRRAEHALAGTAATWSLAMRTWLSDF